ncbi:hypothetical protein GCM10027614_28130 [Micromonospora vulcania]
MVGAEAAQRVLQAADRERRALLQRHATQVEEQMRLLQRQYDHLREKIRFYERLPGQRSRDVQEMAASREATGRAGPARRPGPRSG